MVDGEADKEFPKIRALGPLFRNTEVFLWDDAGVITSGISTHNGYLSLEPAASSSFQTRKLNSCTTTEEESSTDHTITDYLCVEELALAQQMDALGLPLSFGTSKARNNVTATSKRNGTKSKYASHEKERNNPVPQIMVFSQMENPALSTSLHDSTNMSSCLYAMEGQGDAPYHDAKEHSRGDLHFDESISISSLGSRNETGKKPVLDEVSDAHSGSLAKFEFSPDTVSFELNAEVLGSLSLHSSSCPEEILEDACSRAQFGHDGYLLNKHDLNRCSDDSSISCCNMYLKDVTETLQKLSVSAESSLLHSLGDHHDNFICCERRDWRVMWDSFYERNYFFNVQTLESTWYPPLGLEKYAFSYSNLSRKETHVSAAEKNAGSEYSRGSISVVMASLPENGGGFHFTDEQPDAEQHVEVSAKMEAGIDFASHYTPIGNGNSNVQLSLYPSYVTDNMKDEENECKDLDELKEKQQGDILGSYYGHDCSMPTINENGNAFSFPETYTNSAVGLDTAHENVVINKKRRVRKSQSLRYWFQRYSLFSKFDNGIKMDEESWFSVTPEQIAKHHAFQCGTGTIIDCFTGVGGNAIQFAMRSNHVIAIDVDPQKIDYAHHNAVIYEVSERIDFIKGDFFKIAPSLKGDVAFLAPPWGGPDYAKMRTYDIRSLKPREGYYLFKIASMIAPKVVMFLPRNVNLKQLVDLSLSACPPWNLEVEKNYLNGKLKSITAYFDKTTPD